jgi:hypothetical protein
VFLLAGWLVLHGLSSVQSPATSAGSSPGVESQLAALQQQTERLRRDLAETGRQIESRRAATEIEQAPLPAAARSPDSPPVGLAAERKALAELIATGRAIDDELERRRTYLEQFKEDPKLAFKSQFDLAYGQRLPEAEAEVAKLSPEQLSARRKKVEAESEARRKGAALLLADARIAAERADVLDAIDAAGDYALLAANDEMVSAVKFLRELNDARPYNVMAVLVGIPIPQLRHIIAQQRLPDDWPKTFGDPAVREGARESAVRLAPLVLSLQEKVSFIGELFATQDEIDLEKRRKLLFLNAAESLYDAGELKPTNVGGLIDAFGAFNLDKLSPLVDDVLVKDSRETAEETGKDYIPAVARGDIKPMTLRQLYAECRQGAGDAWPPDDRPHPLAGRWKGPAQWELVIDPPHDAITWARRAPKAEFEQRLCKIGPDYLIAYEMRVVPGKHVNTDPFGHEKFNHNDRSDGPDDPLPGQAIAFTYYSLGKGGGVLELRRRLMAASFVQQNANQTLWQLISMPEQYRAFPATYRRIKQ